VSPTTKKPPDVIMDRAVAEELRRRAANLTKGDVLRINDILEITAGPRRDTDTTVRMDDGVPLVLDRDLVDGGDLTIHHSDFMAGDAALFVVAERKSPRVYHPVDIRQEMEAVLADMQAKLEAQPKKPCAGGCGVLMPNGAACEPCAEKIADRKERSGAVHDSNIPARYRDLTLRGELIAKCVKDPVALAKLRERGPTADMVTCLGAAGVGKTTAAFALARRWAWDAKRPFLYVTAYELARAPREHELGDDEAPAVARAKSSPFLILDDLGSEPAAPNSPIPELLHDRHADLRRTCVTTWMTKAQIAGKYGDGALRRLLEAPALVLEMRAPGGKS
jgi:hypothetical protein